MASYNKMILKPQCLHLVILLILHITNNLDCRYKSLKFHGKTDIYIHGKRHRDPDKWIGLFVLIKLMV